MIAWTLRDTVTDETFTFGTNPNDMSSPFTQHDTQLWSISRQSTSRRAWRKPFVPFEWTFGGVVLTADEYATLKTVSRRSVKFELTDHFGRAMTIRIVTFKPEQKAPMRRRHPWRHTYQMTCLVYSQPTRFGDL